MVDVAVNYVPQRALDAALLGVLATASAFSGYGLSNALVGWGWAQSSPEAAWWTTPCFGLLQHYLNLLGFGP